MRIILTLACILFSISLTQCAAIDLSKRVRQQGNLLPQSKIEKLKVGMSKEQVAIVMGTSLLSPMFNNDRWDYAYSWRRANGPIKMKHITLYFTHDQLKKIEQSQENKPLNNNVDINEE